MAEFDWEEAWRAAYCLGTGCDRFCHYSYRDRIETIAKKYAAWELRRRVGIYRVPRNISNHFTGEAVARDLECDANELDPQPEVIQLEKGKVYRFPDGAEVRT